MVNIVKSGFIFEHSPLSPPPLLLLLILSQLVSEQVFSMFFKFSISGSARNPHLS